MHSQDRTKPADFFSLRGGQQDDSPSDDKDGGGDGGVTESTPLMRDPKPMYPRMTRFLDQQPPTMDDSSDSDDYMTIQEKAAMFDRHSMAAEHLSVRLLQIPDDDPEEEERVLRQTLDLSYHVGVPPPEEEEKIDKRVTSNMFALVSIACVAIVLVVALSLVGAEFVGPPRQPIGPYQLVERQEGLDFFSHYNFYEGRDSAGSNGYLNYIGMDQATKLGILNVTLEQDIEDVFAQQSNPSINSTSEPFVYMGSSPTDTGPRNSIRLEGKRRFNRGLFIIDLRHMPAGCGVWPAFWLTDEANWPINGEIDIVEGVNYQSVAKTALHSTKGCNMDDVPIGVKTGEWDTAIGIPDKKTGIPDMTLRYATDCFVYDPKQWLNQGCVAVDKEGSSLGVPVNKQGGGVYVLEWDPINRRIRTWVFSPHSKVPDNLRSAIRTASEPVASERILPDPDLWPLPYGYFAIGDETDCPAYHFRNMRLVFNLAFCGSVAGNRFHMDCPKQAKKFKTCNDWIKSDPDELKEAYWKVRGVYVYDREWQKAWL